MGGSSMSSIMLMGTMVVLSWRSNMMEKHIILNTLDMVDMFKTEGFLCRRRGSVQEGYLDPEVPHRARHCHKLGRHGENLAPHLLQRAQGCPRGAPRALD